MSYKTLGIESEYRFATWVEAGKHGVDLAIERLGKTDLDSVCMNVTESDDPVNAVHEGNSAKRLA